MIVLALLSSIAPGAAKRVVSLFTGPRRLESGVVHEIVATPSVSVLLTQFTDR